MRIFLSAMEDAKGQQVFSRLVAEGQKPLWNLMSYYYVSKGSPKVAAHAERVRDMSELVMIDSGAHSFQKGAKVEWEQYTHQYAQFIREFDRSNVVGYFEMDVDNVIGYQRVLRLREILEKESGLPEKIIPVWHKGRGIDEFKAMCESHRGQTVAVTGFKNEDIQDRQYPMFLRYAWSCGCKLHCLGMTRKKVLDKVPFDYCDSSSWLQEVAYGRVQGRKVNHAFQKASRENRAEIFYRSYCGAMEMQMHYYRKWRKVNND